MKLTKVRENFLYNAFYQLLTLVLPIITVPYVSRILNADGIGAYSYTYSFVSYFMLVSLLGINNYGNRKVAKERYDKDKLSKEFLGIYTVQIVMTLLMILTYVILLLFVFNDYKEIRFIELIYIISCLFDVNWFFYGLEKFKMTVARNTIIRILSVILIFTFVKTKNDIYIYTIIQALSTLLSCLLIYPILFKNINFVKIDKRDILKHVKPCLILFIPVVAVSLYKIMDKIMLGFMTSVSEVGFYEQAEKIINIPLGLVTSLGVTLMPKISNLVAKKESETIKKYIGKSIKFIFFLSFPIVFGLVSVASDFIPLFLGSDFTPSVYIVYFLSFTIIFISFANIIRQEYLIPMEDDKTYVYSVIGGALVNLVLNIMLINYFKSVGAAVATVLSEFFVLAYQTYKVKEKLPIDSYLRCGFTFFWKSLLMFAFVMFIKLLDVSVLLKLIMQVSSGILIYILLNLNYIKENITIRKK